MDKSDMKNERFEKYYQEQGIIPEEEWEGFMDSMRGPLPTTFRVAGSRQSARSLSTPLKKAHLVSEPHIY